MRLDRRHLAALAVAILASACSSDSSTSPATVQTTSLSQLLGEFAAPGLAAISNVAGVPGVSTAGLAAATCSYASTSQSFVCPTVSASGLTLSQSYVLLSAAGAPMAAYDASTVAAIRTTSSATGTISDPSGPLTVDTRQTMTLSGLLTGTHTLNGTGTTHLVRSGSTAAGTIDVTNTFTNVVLPAQGGGSAYPASGTVTSTVSSAIGGTATSSTITMTFNGTSKIPVTVGGLGATVRCTIDIASSTSSCS